jgi:hypothetical protein
MAKLSDENFNLIFNLLRQVAAEIENASATEWQLFEGYGENDLTIPELEELKGAKEKLTNAYSRLNTILLRILDAQPIAPADMLDFLERTIEQTQMVLYAAQASIIESKRIWNLP